MQFILRVSAFMVVGIALSFFLRCEMSSETSPEDEEAYRDWMVSMAQKQGSGWDDHYGIADQSGVRNYDQEPYADPDLYAENRLVLQPGQRWQGEVELMLPDDASRHPDVSQLQVVRNEWQDLGVKVTIDKVWTDEVSYPTWQVRGERGNRTLAFSRPVRSIRQTGAMSRQGIIQALVEGEISNVDGFDPNFDLVRGQENGWRARVRYTISVNRQAPIRYDEPSRWGEFTIADGSRGDTYKAHLIHLENYEGVAVRPVVR